METEAPSEPRSGSSARIVCGLVLLPYTLRAPLTSLRCPAGLRKLTGSAAAYRVRAGDCRIFFELACARLCNGLLAAHCTDGQ